jgi:hypothetical protein
MTIHPKDLRTLLIRVLLVTLAIRAVPLFSTDLAPGEVAAAWGLAANGPSAEPVAQFHSTWTMISGGSASLTRLPTLLLELVLPLLAVGLARVAGWGAIPGLLAGLILAMAPLGIDGGFRVDGGSLAGVGALLSLWLLRRGLRDASVPWVVASGVAVAVAGFLASPVLLMVPGGLYLAWRAVTTDRLRTMAAGTWALAAVVALGLRWLVVGALANQANAAAAWLLDPALSGVPSGFAHAPVVSGAHALIASLPGGPIGAMARQLGLTAAPWWTAILGALLGVVAVWGLGTGRVRPDPVDAEEPPVSTEEGAGEQDGWRTLGVSASALPRELGDRDSLPLALGLLGAVTWVAVAASQGTADGVVEAMGVARAVSAVLLGLGLTAVVMPGNLPDETQARPVRRRFLGTMALFALGIFALGAMQLLAHTQAPDRMAGRKVAVHVRETIGQTGIVVALGPRGLPVAFLLDPLRNHTQVLVSSLNGDAVQTVLAKAVAAKPDQIVLAGDRDALGGDGHTPVLTPMGPLYTMIEASLATFGYLATDDGHRYLGDSAGRTFALVQAGDPTTLRPQLAPGQTP